MSPVLGILGGPSGPLFNSIAAKHLAAIDVIAKGE